MLYRLIFFLLFIIPISCSMQKKSELARSADQSSCQQFPPDYRIPERDDNGIENESREEKVKRLLFISFGMPY